MKKFAFMLISLALFSCSKSDEPISSSTNKLNPPSWIHGTWIGMIGSGSTQTSTGIGFKFTSDNWCSVLGTTTSCWKEVIDSSMGQVTVNEEISNTDYIVKIKTGGTTETYHFKKYSNTEIEFVSGNGYNPRYTKQ
jgi:hypothetical protein